MRTEMEIPIGSAPATWQELAMRDITKNDLDSWLKFAGSTEDGEYLFEVTMKLEELIEPMVRPS
ncbi:hypothetical protein N7513_002762 [Penicillium frequentans]|nr:hypothetical protein N7513_002762 [Penicillium glabrum]